MRNFNRGGKSGRGGSFNTRGFGSRDSGRATMYKATCANCGKECEIPFKPRGDKPVYCSNCFEGKRGRDEGSRRPSYEEKRMFPATCDECGKKCEVPFRPTKGKPIYCQDCFGKKGGRKSKGGSQPSSQQFDILNKKLDQILQALAPASTQKSAPKKEAAKKAKSALAKKTVKKTASKKAKK